MLKTRRSQTFSLSVRLPPKRVRDKFLIIYELKGCQQALNFLTDHYGVKRMKVILDGKRVAKGCCGCYEKNRAYFTKKGLTRRIILHELYHHLAEARGFQIQIRTEEREANSYAKSFLKK